MFDFHDVFQQGEILSPYRLCLCMILHEAHHCRTTSEFSPEGSDQVMQFLQAKTNAIDTTFEPTLYGLALDLCGQLGQAGKHLQMTLIRGLEGIQVPEDLINTCEACWGPEMLKAKAGDKKGFIEPQSPEGRFLRGCRLAVLSMPFEVLVHMLTNVRGYLEVYQQELRLRLAIETPEDTAAADTCFASTRMLRPAPQLAACLAHHGDRVRQLAGMMPLQAVAADLDSVAAAAPGVPIVHAAKAHISTLSKTYNAALSELLHFHDHALPASMAAQAGGRAHGVPAGADGRSRPLQTALLSLSQLHLEHGHMEAATTALLEAVDTDQGSGDTEALVLCLLQLCIIMRATPPFEHDRGAQSPTAMMQGSAAKHIFLLEQLLQRCVAQAAAQRLPVFFANATLALAELASQHQPQPAGAPTTASVAVLRAAGEPRLAYSVSEGKGEKRAEGGAVQVQPGVATGVSPAVVVWEYSICLAEMEHACQQAAMPPATAKATPAADGTTEMTRSDLYALHADCFPECMLVQGEAPAAAAAVSLARGRMHLVSASVWRRHGCASLAAAEAASFLACHALDLDDTLHAYATLALIANDRQGPSAAALIIETADDMYPLAKNLPLQAARLEVAFWQELRHGRVRAARATAAKLTAMPNPHGRTEFDFRVQAEELLIKAMIAGGECEHARKHAAALFANCHDAGLQVEATSAQLTIAAAFAEAQQPALALPHVLNALYHATALHLDVLAASATVALAEIKLRLTPGMAAAARALVEEHLCLIESQAPLELVARAHLLLAESYLRTTLPDDLPLFRPELEHSLSRAAEACRKAEWWPMGRKVAALLAMARRVLGDITGCDEAARAALAFDGAMERSRQVVLV
eukprot:jgi/Ulvmu1/10851/UM007_0025.1